ncbi:MULTISPECIES: cytochrome P450 [Nostocales]|uniref:Cytochrome P450 n=2 Tax=Nostocales TaxID=1161 RepID=A0A0C1QZ63_9CYAN|nr:cytochrome P450 [Tolypothrix bouteillei]KAF3886799.1 cytochrome P450 [Tolypothrix bouteillei VB521301]
MKATNSLPDGPRMPVFLRWMKFIFQPLEYVEDFAKTYGDNFTIWGRDNSHKVYFSHPQALQQIFTADSTQLEAGKGNTILKFLVGANSLLLLDGNSHQRQRQLLAPPFHGDRMRAYGMAIAEITEQVSKTWENGKPFSIHLSMQEITLRVILRVVFGFDEGSRLEQMRYLLASLLNSMDSPLMFAALFLKFLQQDLGAWSPWGRVVNLLQQIDEMIYGLIRERRAESNQSREDVLSLMMHARDINGETMTDEELRDELMTLLVAGHETTAAALTWAFYWIDKLPEVREKLQRELDTVSHNPDLSTIAKLPYLTAVCQETLRIYPVAITASPRIVRSPIEIMGYNLPVGTIIFPSVYLAHHREEVYPQSKQFKPERFLERQFSPYEYLPFGGGTHRCIGMAFALYEMKLVLATILSQFQLSSANKHPARPVRRGLTLVPSEGMQMVATPIEKRVKTLANL